MKEKITIITTPHSDYRIPYLKRFLNYYAKFESSPNIIIADSSPSSINDPEIIAHFKAPNISYYKYSHDTRFESKIVTAIEKVSTPYAVICTEDDLITIKGAEVACEVLTQNANISAVSGYLIRYITNENKPIIKLKMKMTAIDDNSIKERVENYITKFDSPVFSSVYRTKTLLHIWKLTVSCIESDDVWFGEELPAFLTPIYGKIYSIESLYWVRENFIDSLSASPETYHFKDMIIDGSYQRRYKKFKGCLVQEMCANARIDTQEAENLIEASYKIRFKKLFGYSLYSLSWIKVHIEEFLLKNNLSFTGSLLYRFLRKLKHKLIRFYPVNTKPLNNHAFPELEWKEVKAFLEENIISE